MVAGLVRKYKSTDQYHVKKNIAKVSSSSDSSRNKLRMDSDDDEQSYFREHCLPERRYILRPQLQASDSSVSSGDSDVAEEVAQQAGVTRILESISYLCLGGGMSVEGVEKRERRRTHRKSSLSPHHTTRKKVVYPIASYPASLNSKSLVEQRRKSLPHHFFRPVPSKI